MCLAVCAFPQQRSGALVSKDKSLGSSRLLYCQENATGEKTMDWGKILQFKFLGYSYIIYLPERIRYDQCLHGD